MIITACGGTDKDGPAAEWLRTAQPRRTACGVMALDSGHGFGRALQTGAAGVGRPDRIVADCARAGRRGGVAPTHRADARWHGRWRVAMGRALGPRYRHAVAGVLRALAPAP